MKYVRKNQCQSNYFLEYLKNNQQLNNFDFNSI
jgi:hypothetical protein